jgi:diaminopimelate decarboxylase
MDAFTYQGGELFAEGVALSELADVHGTPLYVYSRNHMRSQFQRLAEAMHEVEPLICYSVKANSNASVLKTFVDAGAGFDVVSSGELYRALRAGADASRIVFAGVGKTVEEISYAIASDILFFTVESEPEAERISACAVEAGRTARIAFRINPDVDPKTHRYISTGKQENKFGLNVERALSAYETAAAFPNIEISGLHMHIGSQILNPQPFRDALDRVAPLCVELKQMYATFQYLDIGGGLGIRYQDGDTPLDPAAYAEQVVPVLRELGLQVILEPGRSMCGNAGVLLCRVQYVKDNPLKQFVVVDAGMNDLIRPALYTAHHDILPVKETAETIHGDLVGPICETGDFFASDRDLPAVSANDLVAVCSVGAYGFTMASTYNSRPLPAEVMVDGTRSWIVRERETWDDIIRSETDPHEC